MTIEGDGLSTVELPAVERAATTVVHGARNSSMTLFKRSMSGSSGPESGPRRSMVSSTSTVTVLVTRG